MPPDYDHTIIGAPEGNSKKSKKSSVTPKNGGKSDMVVTARPVKAEEAGSAPSKDMKKSELKSKNPSLPPLPLDFAVGWEQLRQFIDQNCIARAPPGSHELPTLEDPSKYYAWQFYLRSALLNAEHLDYIGKAFWRYHLGHYQEKPFQIAGVESSSVPVLTALLMEARNCGIALRAFSIRKERKAYGLRNIIEGQPDRNLPVFLVDDIASPTHATLWHALGICRDAGLRLYSSAFVVLFKGRRNETSNVLRTSGGPVSIQYLYALNEFSLTLRIPSEEVDDV